MKLAAYCNNLVSQMTDARSLQETWPFRSSWSESLQVRLQATHEHPNIHLVFKHTWETNVRHKIRLTELACILLSDWLVPRYLQDGLADNLLTMDYFQLGILIIFGWHTWGYVSHCTNTDVPMTRDCPRTTPTRWLCFDCKALTLASSFTFYEYQHTIMNCIRLCGTRMCFD